MSDPITFFAHLFEKAGYKPPERYVKPEKGQCRYCGSKRQRNLIFEYEPQSGNWRVTCFRCLMLVEQAQLPPFDPEDKHRIISGRRPLYRYKNKFQLMQTKEFVKEEL